MLENLEIRCGRPALRTELNNARELNLPITVSTIAGTVKTLQV